MTEPVLVEVTRAGHVESEHRGSFVLLDADGRVELAVGDAGPVFARSALKPLQATAMMHAGWRADATSVALAAASHNGEPIHLRGVRTTLAVAGLGESVLQCPPALPAATALVEYVAGGGRAASVCHECSGKHAAMTATCVAAGWDVATYLDAGHPLQQAIVAEVDVLCGSPVAFSSVDGCGAPAHAVPLASLARAFGRLGRAETGSAAGVVADAMRAHPQLVAGAGRVVTELMDEVGGLIAKDGAEGIVAAALPDGRAFAAKVDDGSARAISPVLAAAVRHWGHDGPALRCHAALPVTVGGADVRVGEVRWSAEFADLLDLPPFG